MRRIDTPQAKRPLKRFHAPLRTSSKAFLTGLPLRPFCRASVRLSFKALYKGPSSQALLKAPAHLHVILVHVARQVPQVHRAFRTGPPKGPCSTSRYPRPRCRTSPPGPPSLPHRPSSHALLKALAHLPKGPLLTFTLSSSTLPERSPRSTERLSANETADLTRPSSSAPEKFFWRGGRESDQ